MKKFLAIAPVALATLIAPAMAETTPTTPSTNVMTGAVVGVQAGMTHLGSNSKVDAFNGGAVHVNEKAKFSKNGLIGGVFARYGFSVSENVILSPEAFINFDNAKATKSVETLVAEADKYTLTRSYELGLGGSAHYAINPMTTIGGGVSVLYSSFKTKVDAKTDALKSGSDQKNKFGLGLNLAVNRALTTDGRYRAGLVVSHHMYPTFKTKDFGTTVSGVTSTAKVKNKPTYTSVMLQFGIKLGA